jgi:hypothetical protein
MEDEMTSIPEGEVPAKDLGATAAHEIEEISSLCEREEALMEDKIRSRPELLQPADLEAADDIVADLIEEELSVGDFMLAIAAATVGITVALIRRESCAPSSRFRACARYAAHCLEQQQI